MAKIRVPQGLQTVKHLRYTLERLNRQDRGIMVEGMGGRLVKRWYVDEANDLVVLVLEDEPSRELAIPET